MNVDFFSLQETCAGIPWEWPACNAALAILKNEVLKNVRTDKCFYEHENIKIVRMLICKDIQCVLK
jgi:hypothetical protein